MRRPRSDGSWVFDRLLGTDGQRATMSDTPPASPLAPPPAVAPGTPPDCLLVLPPDPNADLEGLDDNSVQHALEYWAVSEAQRVWCQGCNQKWSHGRRHWKCKTRGLCFCTVCKLTVPKCEIPQGLRTQDAAGGAGLQDLLQDWVTQPAPPAQLLARQIRGAVDATMAAHDTSEGAMRDSLEAKALLEHQLLWATPALLTRRMPEQHETDRARVQKGEQGMWTDLLQEAPQERETRTDDWKSPR